MIAFLIFVVLPALVGLGLSFFDWDLFSTPEFVGVDNFVRLIGDAAMWKSLGVTALFVIMGVLPTTVLGFCLAVVANSGIRGASAFRILYFLPLVASSAVASAIWINIYQPRAGLLNSIIGLFGVQGPAWLTDPATARPALVLMMIWSALPVVIILYIAALQRIPDDLYSAAALDGANKWRQLWSITWPSVAGTTGLVLVLQLIGFLGGTLETALIMTGGGPLGETTSLALYAYNVGFERREVGYASAVSLFQLAILAVGFVLYRIVMHGRTARA
ncbi:carbohydrate ABC transporter permease [Microbacterium saperdae]